MKIAFGHKYASGKDTSADYLIKKYGGIKLSFASPLYDILHYAQNICSFPKEKDRKFLQWIGTEWARNKDPNIWINILIEKARKEEGNVYVSDVRFLNEFTALKEDGWICIKLNRESQNRDTTEGEHKGIGSGEKNHISETELDSITDDNWDFVIDNNGNIEDLYFKLDEIINNVLNK